MKLFIILLLSPLISLGQYHYDTIPIYYSCTYKFCKILNHRILGGYIIKEPEGFCIYGPQQSLIGFITKYGFVPIIRRDHLIGKNLDRELLEDSDKMKKYLKTIL